MPHNPHTPTPHAPHSHTPQLPYPTYSPPHTPHPSHSPTPHTPVGSDQGKQHGNPVSPPVLHQRTVCGCHSRQNLRHYQPNRRVSKSATYFSVPQLPMFGGCTTTELLAVKPSVPRQEHLGPAADPLQAPHYLVHELEA